MTAPLLHVDGLAKRYTRGWLRPQTTFSLEADFSVEGRCVVGVMGPNGSGKTTLFELITGSSAPSAGRVLVAGQDIHIGFMLDFFRKLRADGKLVFLCLHPNEPYHLDILRESCERFVFVRNGRLSFAPSFDALLDDEAVRTYLGRLANTAPSAVAPA
ncbi:MAG: ATP-binding cassette domain-containing protein [Caldimonas sp.]